MPPVIYKEVILQYIPYPEQKETLCHHPSFALTLQRTGAWAAGEPFTLADVVLGLSVNRWRMTPFAHPDVPAIDAWFMRLNQRPAFLRHGNNGMV